MKGKRMLAALLAAALTGGITYAYAAPVYARNDGVFWRTADGEPVRVYNRYGQPVAVYQLAGVGQPPSWIVRNVYDRDGNRLRVSQTLADGRVEHELRWTYDREGRVLTRTQIQGQDRLVTTYAYALDARGRVVRVEAREGGQTQSTVCKTYVDRSDGGWCETAVYQGPILLDSGAAVDPLTLLGADEPRFARWETVYDADGTVQRITAWEGADVRSWDYTYNESGQPVAVVEWRNGQLVGRETIAYDAHGQVSARQRDTASGRMSLVFRETDPILA